MRQHRGFTLLEILLVLFVLSLTTMVVVLSLPHRSQDKVQQTAESLYRRLQLLSEDAIYSGRSYGLYVDEKKHEFRFLVLNDQGWQPLQSSAMKGTLSVEDGIRFRFDPGGGVWNNPDRLFNQDSLFEEMDFPQEEKKKIEPPQVVILSSGDVTPFSLLLWENGTQDAQWTVETGEDGILHIKSPLGTMDEAG